MPTPHTPTIAARRGLRKLGDRLRAARIHRLLPMQVVADRAFISRGTLMRIEKGDPAVSFGAYASVLHALNLVRSIDLIAADDPVGEQLAKEKLPKRVRLPSKKPKVEEVKDDRND